MYYFCEIQQNKLSKRTTDIISYSLCSFLFFHITKTGSSISFSTLEYFPFLESFFPIYTPQIPSFTLNNFILLLGFFYYDGLCAVSFNFIIIFCFLSPKEAVAFSLFLEFLPWLSQLLSPVHSSFLLHFYCIKMQIGIWSSF